MSDNEIGIAIVEACGWQWWCCEQFTNYQLRPPQVDERTMNRRSPLYTYRRCAKPAEVTGIVYTPDFPNDLNAMREAWLTLNDKERVMFRHNLHVILERDGKKKQSMQQFSEECFEATAKQWSEAFLKAKQLWKP